MTSRKENLEFNIVWCESNLRWLAREPQSEERTRKEKCMIAQIERCNKELEELK